MGAHEFDKILNYVREYPGSKVKLAVCDLDGILRGKVIHRDKFMAVVEKGIGFCDVIFGWDSSDLSYEGIDFTGWHTGYPDIGAQIDIATFRKIPWEKNMPFFLADFCDENQKAIPVCPRNLLKTIRQQAVDQGFSPIFSQEFEWFNFQETPEELNRKEFTQINPLTPGMFGYSILRSSQKSDYFNDLFDLLKDFEVPLEGLHTETGPGVYEAAILYDEVLTAADRAILFKTGVKEIAYRHQLMASFMAKWSEKLPGCSGHVHQSLWNAKRTENLFYDSTQDHHMSELMQNYIAGQLYCLPHIFPLYAPTINSYKRLVEGAWAPTTLTWGYDNRTTALRILTQSQNSARLENRVCGSDTNPYLAMAGCLASGLYGVKNKLKLDQPHTVGNGYRDLKYGTLPSDLNKATESMKESDLAKELLGEEFVNHFVQTREWEWKQFGKAVTNWELKRYFEII